MKLREPVSKYIFLLVSLTTLFFSGCSTFPTNNVILTLPKQENYSLDACVGHPALSAQGSLDYCETQRPKFPELVVRDTPEVRYFIKFFQSERKRFMEESLERSVFCMKDMTDILEAYGLPKRLIGVALVESGFKSKARSRRGAVGMWQIMPRTARYLGLSVNIFVDQRKDIIKSTAAAARYLAELYNRFDDWYLALAAYNAGPTRVSRAIRKANSRDFYEIARRGFLKKETVQFVPKVLAAALISSRPRRFGFIGNREGVVRFAGDKQSNNNMHLRGLASADPNRNRL